MLFGRQLIPLVDLGSHPAGHRGIGLPVGCPLEGSEALEEVLGFLVSFLPFPGTIRDGTSDRMDPFDPKPAQELLLRWRKAAPAFDLTGQPAPDGFIGLLIIVKSSGTGLAVKLQRLGVLIIPVSGLG